MPGEDRIDGNLRDFPCANTGSRKTATSPSVSGVLSASNGVHTTGLIPLYLIAHIISTKVKGLGGAIPEMHVKLGGRRLYAITVVVQE